MVSCRFSIFLEALGETNRELHQDAIPGQDLRKWSSKFGILVCQPTNFLGNHTVIAIAVSIWQTILVLSGQRVWLSHQTTPYRRFVGSLWTQNSSQLVSTNIAKGQDSTVFFDRTGLVSGVFTMHHVSTQFFFTFSKAIPWRTWNWAAAAAIPRWVTWLAAWSPSGAGPQDVKLRDKRMHQPDLVHSIVIVYICYNYMYVYIYIYIQYIFIFIYIYM